MQAHYVFSVFSSVVNGLSSRGRASAKERLLKRHLAELEGMKEEQPVLKYEAAPQKADEERAVE